MSFEILALVGPTASGKTDLALQLARRFAAEGQPVEIINADAMQLYRYMNIGTAKLSEADRNEIPHHLFDVIAPDQEVTAVEYKGMARALVSEIRARGALPLVVGGSMFYLAAAIDELDFAPTDPAIRNALEVEAEQLGGTALHDRLQSLDPLTAQRIPPQNTRRVIRALEVIAITGEVYQSELPEPKSYVPTCWIGLNVDREVLKQRIQKRVDLMWQEGLLKEAQWLRANFELSRTAAVAIGYKQAFAQLDGTLTEDEAKMETVSLTSRYARRQMSWFRRDRRIQWVDSDRDALENAMNQIRLEK